MWRLKANLDTFEHRKEAPDVVCVQEIAMSNRTGIKNALRAIGYKLYDSPGYKGNGVRENLGGCGCLVKRELRQRQCTSAVEGLASVQTIEVED